MNVEILSRIDALPVPVNEVSHALGQQRGVWHHRAVDKERDDRDVGRERRFDLDTNRVIGLGNARLAASSQPMPADDDKDDIAFAQRLRQVLSEIDGKRNAVDIAIN